MNTNIQIFKNEVFGEIRTITNDEGEIFFVGKDVAMALGYKNPSNALQVHVDSEDKTSYLIQVSGSNYNNKLGCITNGFHTHLIILEFTILHPVGILVVAMTKDEQRSILSEYLRNLLKPCKD